MTHAVLYNVFMIMFTNLLMLSRGSGNGDARRLTAIRGAHDV